jgi:xanthine/CO dehydrogenase XdhC/CoxF family maturation factor
MKEIQKIISTYEKVKASNQQIALATVVHVEGSSYRRTGARMLIMEDGNWVGGISGGCLEGDALRKAKNAMVQSKPTLVTYDTREDDQHQIGVGLGCNGLIKVLITPIRQGEYNPIEVLKSAVAGRNVKLLLTIADAPDKVLIGTMFTALEDAAKILNKPDLIVSLEQDVIIAMQKHRSATVSYELNGENWSFFVEIVPPAIHLVLYGGNYDIYPMAQLAKNIGWNVTIVTNPQKASKAFYEVSDAIVSKQQDFRDFDTFSAAVLMNHDYKTDKAQLVNLLSTNVPYVGMLGPKNRAEKILNELAAEGIIFSASALTRLHAPIGLDTGAITPEEIAVSILAEIRTVFSNRTGGFLKRREGTIHEREG